MAAAIAPCLGVPRLATALPGSTAPTAGRYQAHPIAQCEAQERRENLLRKRQHTCPTRECSLTREAVVVTHERINEELQAKHDSTRSKTRKISRT